MARKITVALTDEDWGLVRERCEAKGWGEFSNAARVRAALLDWAKGGDSDQSQTLPALRSDPKREEEAERTSKAIEELSRRLDVVELAAVRELVGNYTASSSRSSAPKRSRWEEEEDIVSAIRLHARPLDGWLRASHEKIARLSGVAKSRVGRRLDSLVEAGILEKWRGRPNSYRIIDDLW